MSQNDVEISHQNNCIHRICSCIFASCGYLFYFSNLLGLECWLWFCTTESKVDEGETLLFTTGVLSLLFPLDHFINFFEGRVCVWGVCMDFFVIYWSAWRNKLTQFTNKRKRRQQKIIHRAAVFCCYSCETTPNTVDLC